ncbi:MAG: gliding motility-associated C-terminal domain-containing protein [Bacteroidales bacterium]
MFLRYITLVAIFVPYIGFGQGSEGHDDQHYHEHEAKNVLFEENKGQWGEAPIYRSSFHGGYAYFESGQVKYVVKDMEAVSNLLGFKMKSPEYRKKNTPEPDIPHHAYTVNYEGSNKDAEVVSRRKTDDYVNYYLGNDPSHWASNVRKFREIEYLGLYDGINLRYEQLESFMKYTFTIEPGADPAQIVKNYKHVDRLRLKDGQLMVKTSVQDIIENMPYAYQVTGDDTVEVACEFELEDKNVSYTFPEGYDSSATLYIDPTLVFSTYTGSTSDNWGYTATYDSEGNAFGGGVSFGSGYPTTTGAYSEDYGGGGVDIVITKFDTTGSNLIYSTYIGGSGVEVPHSLICNSFDELILLGTTSSPDYPTTEFVFDTTFAGGSSFLLTDVIDYANGSDIVVSRLAEDGTALEASTYVGGSDNDGLNISSSLSYNYADEVRGEVMVDENDMIYVASSTHSQDFPMGGKSFQNKPQGGQDGIVFKMTMYLDGLLWAGYMGGSGDDAVYNINVSEDFSVYVAGGTTSQDLPVTPNAHQTNYNGGQADGFVAEIDNSGTQLVACTYYGTDEYDQIYFIDQDLDGGIYLLGQTGHDGTNYIYNAPWSQVGGGQFVSQINGVLETITFSTAFGNPNNSGPDISPTTFMVDYCGSLYIAGWGGQLNGFGGTSGLPVTSNAFQTTTDDNDYYFMVLDKDAQDLQYATFFGGDQSSGEHVDGGTSRFSKKGAIYQAICSGCGGYSDMPTTPGAWSSTNNSSNCNLAVVKFDFDVKAVIADFERPKSGCVPYTITFENRSYSSGTKTHYLWDFGDGDTSMAYNPTHTYTQKGTYEITLVVVDSTTCNIADSIKYQILVLGDTVEVLPDVQVCKGDSIEIGIDPYDSPNVMYNWSPVFYDPTIPTQFMPTSHISRSRATVLPRNDTTFYLVVFNQVCADSIVQFVEVIDLEADAGPDLELCDSAFSITGHGSGNDSLKYIWSSDGYFSDTLNTNLDDSTLNYTLKTNNKDFFLKVTDGNCEDEDTVNVSFLIDIADSTKTPTCYGDCDGSIHVAAYGGNPPYSYTWSNGQTGQSITNLCDGVYTVTVYDADSCLAVKEIHLQEPQPLLSNTKVSNAPCEEVCIGEIEVNPTGGTSPYSYSWSDGQTGSVADQLCVGEYVVTITDDHGCTEIDTAEVEDMSVHLDFQAFADSDTIAEGQSTRIYTQDTAGYFYSWTPVAGLKSPNSASTKASPKQTTTYVVTISDQYGCTFTDTVTIHVKPVTCDDPYIFVPNAFTPDGDGKNDVLYVRTQFADNLYFAVYNRWGEKVFETKDINEGWDGTIEGEKAEKGVYVYYLRVVCFTGEVYEDSGNVTLIR